MMRGGTVPELRVARWVDGEGNPTEPQTFAQRSGLFKVVFCFQAWCQGCHSMGFPTLKKLVEAFRGDDRVSFLAIQTVFEGLHENTWEAMLKNQQEYGLGIPFGHDTAEEGEFPRTMVDFSTGGTPWFLLIDQRDRLLFGNFHLDTDKAIAFIRGTLGEPEA
ncbi:MAG: TlpA family protein disulfide reductase [Flavobacteriales bacterium]|nr:TlpA family protein disulfide reductase [Flavobacteriales bacterium]